MESSECSDDLLNWMEFCLLLKKKINLKKEKKILRFLKQIQMNKCKF